MTTIIDGKATAQAVRAELKEEIAALLGRGRAKKGIFEGDLENGELEIGQNVSQFKQILPVKTVMESLVAEYKQAAAGIAPLME